MDMRQERADEKLREVVWVGSSLDDLRHFPDEVRREIGFVLDRVQRGKDHQAIKHLSGFSGVFEVRSDYRTNTYRAVYAVKIGDEIYVLHCFQKKSKRGIETPKKDMDLIRRRLKMAQERSKGERQ
jgi:phage-related protein